MTSREVMMRTVEALATMGVREPRRIMADAVVIHKQIMECEDGTPRTSRKSGQADKAPE